MKKIILTILVFGLLVGNSFAAWTYSQEWLYRVTNVSRTGLVAAGIKVTCTSDGADPAAQALSSVDGILTGMNLYLVVTDNPVGATAADVTYDISFTDVTGVEVLLVDEAALDAPTATIGSTLLTIEPPIGSALSYDFDDIGAAGDIVYMYIYFRGF